MCELGWQMHGRVVEVAAHHLVGSVRRGCPLFNPGIRQHVCSGYMAYSTMLSEVRSDGWCNAGDSRRCSGHISVRQMQSSQLHVCIVCMEPLLTITIVDQRWLVG